MPPCDNGIFMMIHFHANKLCYAIEAAKSLKSNPYKKDYPLYLMKVTNSRKLVKVNQILRIVQEHFGKFLNLCRYRAACRAANFWRHTILWHVKPGSITGICLFDRLI